ncbi:hypothetical protein Sjap_026442 [Stephania japonica]|uniref:sterol 22-desaturase n=1 Tax=Stephania japonica TaxID=461633 RepID=A0AAP0E3Q4_9MAGN
MGISACLTYVSEGGAAVGKSPRRQLGTATAQPSWVAPWRFTFHGTSGGPYFLWGFQYPSLSPLSEPISSSNGRCSNDTPKSLPKLHQGNVACMPHEALARAIDLMDSPSPSSSPLIESAQSTLGRALTSQAAACVFTFIGFVLLLEQVAYLKKRRSVPGPLVVIPFIGNVISLVRDPTKFWNNQASLAKSSNLGISANYIIGRYILFVRDTELSHKIFSNVRPDAFNLIGHPFGKKLFGEHNLIYMFGQEHKDLRRRIAPNFTPKALSIYTALQQEIILKHLHKWTTTSSSNTNNPYKLRMLVREMNLETSQTVFVGPYLSPKAREEFNQDYTNFNIGLMSFPIDLPGFAFRKARLSVERLVKTLGGCVNDSKSRMKLGGHIFDFLFAAQDASTSSLLWAVALLDQHQEVLFKVRQEVCGIWSPESGMPITGDHLREMRYTEAVAREVIRYRAPATLVPHIAGDDFRLSESYTVPKGTIVFPSVFESSFQGFTEPDRFDPDRFSESRQEDQLYKRNFLAFGAGPHQCVGQRYALNHLVLFIAMFTSLIDFKRHRTDGCDEIAYVPTICPKDDCLVYIKNRLKDVNLSK